VCRVAVVGAAGYWGRKYAKAYAEHPSCDLYAIADTAKDRRGDFAEWYGVSEVYDTVEALLEDGIPDICTISLPVSASYHAVLACAAAGVPVITCEKPIAESLAKADEMVDRCMERGVSFSCGTALWEYPLIANVAAWVRDGNIGSPERGYLPDGLSLHVSGNGCVLLVALGLLAGSEAAWIEGWTDPPASAFLDDDCSAYGRIGFQNGAVCEVPPTIEWGNRTGCIGIEGPLGQAWITRSGPVLQRGSGDDRHQVFPPFTAGLPDEKTGMFHRVADAFFDLDERRGGPRSSTRGDAARGASSDGHLGPECLGHRYRQALEIAVALKLSARNNHRRVELPLADRNHILNPVPYRMWGGDVTGWDAVGLEKPEARDGAGPR